MICGVAAKLHFSDVGWLQSFHFWQSSSAGVLFRLFRLQTAQNEADESFRVRRGCLLVEVGQLCLVIVNNRIILRGRMAGKAARAGDRLLFGSPRVSQDSMISTNKVDGKKINQHETPVPDSKGLWRRAAKGRHHSRGRQECQLMLLDFICSIIFTKLRWAIATATPSSTLGSRPGRGIRPFATRKIIPAGFRT
ncbi:uncharacterized protein BDV17DRAFT_204383 [Aspergillus undulatus]|uniref:uncharacterized protein n=1 Tax=Aspergillus undulatus TaxID=1810928 RepID=UPI003CCD1E1D